MKRLAAAVLIAVAALPAGARAADPATLAVELSRLAMPEESWKKMLATSTEQVTRYVEASVSQAGGTVTPEASAAIGREFQRVMPSYQEMVDLQAGLLVKHYTEAEIQQLIAFYRTPVGQKAIRIMPEVSADVNAYLMTLMQARMPGMMERLKSVLEQPSSPQDAAAPAKAPSKKPAAKPN